MSKPTAEVLDAMMAKDVRLKGVHSVIVKGIDNGERGDYLSFSFGSLDPTGRVKQSLG
jgi:hypothetical protein